MNTVKRRLLAQVALWGGAAAILGASSFVQPVAAQETTTEAKPKVQYWFKICPERNGPDGKPVKICVTQHEQFNQRSGELNVAMAIRDQPDRKSKLLITVPLGVALPSGLAVKFDKMKEPIKLTYVFCHAEGCVVETEATDQILDVMRKGARVELSVFHTFYNRPVSFSVPLKGFTSTLKGEPVDGKQYFQRRQQLRIAIRKRTAEAIKKAREEQKKKAEKKQ